MSENPGNASDYWSSVYSNGEQYGRETYWLAIPQVHARYEAKATGNSAENWISFIVNEFLKTDRLDGTFLSVGCGTGILEQYLVLLGTTGQIEGIDISGTAIEKAREAAAGTNIRYRVADMETLALPPKYCDAVIFNSAFHHLKNIEQISEQLQRGLKPGGYLVLNEYVGANRFDFPARQKQAMQAAFALIPEEYRRSCERADYGRVRHALELPDPVDVASLDQSEAVRSADIPALIHQNFDVILENPCRGSLLQFVLNGIAGNFTADDAKAQRILQMLFDIEDGLLESGDLQSDFVLIVARSRL